MSKNRLCSTVFSCSFFRANGLPQFIFDQPAVYSGDVGPVDLPIKPTEIQNRRRCWTVFCTSI